MVYTFLSNLTPDHQAEPFKALLNWFIPTENHLIGEADPSVEDHVHLRCKEALLAWTNSIPHQNISADALEDTAAPKSKEADEGAKVGRVDVLHVRHRHLLNLVASVATGDYVRFLFIKLPASYYISRVWILRRATEKWLLILWLGNKIEHFVLETVCLLKEINSNCEGLSQN